MRGADLIREARTRAGLTQDELSELSGRPRSLIRQLSPERRARRLLTTLEKDDDQDG